MKEPIPINTQLATGRTPTHMHPGGDFHVPEREFLECIGCLHFSSLQPIVLQSATQSESRRSPSYRGPQAQNLVYPGQVEAIIDEFLARTPQIGPELREYARAARA